MQIDASVTAERGDGGAGPGIERVHESIDAGEDPLIVAVRPPCDATVRAGEVEAGVEPPFEHPGRGVERDDPVFRRIRVEHTTDDDRLCLQAAGAVRRVEGPRYFEPPHVRAIDLAQARVPDVLSPAAVGGPVPVRGVAVAGAQGERRDQGRAITGRSVVNGRRTARVGYCDATQTVADVSVLLVWRRFLRRSEERGPLRPAALHHPPSPRMCSSSRWTACGGRKYSVEWPPSC